MLPMTALAARETYTIRFWMVDKQNSNAAAGKTVGMTSAFTVPAPFDTYIEEMAAGGKVFRHWTSEKDGSGKTYAAGTLASKLTTRVGDQVNLYAQWTEGFRIAFHANGGAGAMADQVVENASGAVLNRNAFTMDGAAFLGWSTSENGAVVYADGADIYASAGENIDLYAVWGTTIPTPTVTPNVTPTPAATAQPTVVPTIEPTATPHVTAEPNPAPETGDTGRPVLLAITVAICVALLMPAGKRERRNG